MVQISADMFYGMFATHAIKYGVDKAVESLAFAVDFELLEDMRVRFEADKKKVQTGGPVVIAAGKPDWYPGPMPDDKFWSALFEQFQADGWDDDRLLSVSQSSDKVVAHTAQPGDEGWTTRGLVVGYVQSGKTTNFLATAAKMADLEYGLIIVLSGIHNALRKQTQQRMEEALARVPGKDWFRLTELDRDFRLPSFEAAALLAGKQTGVAVVKKNAAVLRKLRKWLQTDGARAALRERPMLIIDDEADQASVETTIINPLIRDLLKLAAKSTYIGYTATSFANVFIDPYDKDDLYPRDFILSLPRPDGYFGPEKFGRDVITSDLGPTAEPEDGYDMVRTVPDLDVPKLSPGVKDAGAFVPELTPEFADALDWFWLASAARRARKDTGHTSMLIHTSVKTLAHEAFKPVIEAYQADALSGIELHDPSTVARFRDLWDREYPRVQSELFGRTSLSFKQVHEELASVLNTSRVVLDNFRSTDRLDFNASPSQVVIAVGGNTLSRGLTLEGLVVSFFVRAAKTYDTLMQMGRWFGYRHGYEELPRIWMTEQLESDFRHLSRVEYEMRDDIDRYQREDITPEQAAVRISTHPALRITAKMGAGTPRFVSFEGRRFQTRYFKPNDKAWLDYNLEAAHGLIRGIRDVDISIEDGATGARLFRDVSANLVLRFLADYRVHADSPDLDTGLMRSYIERCVSDSESSLGSWSVAIVETATGSPIDVGGIEVRRLIRRRVDDGNKERADIKTLMSKEDRVADLHLSRTQARDASEDELRDLRKDPRYHDCGLLVLYFLEPNGGVKEGSREPLNAVQTPVGIGLVFPGQASHALSVEATKVSVDLSAMEIEAPDDREEGVEDDTETAS